MFNYKIKVRYDGTKYKGWQVQNSTEDTIQGILERVLSKQLDERIELIGSGRTDAGVHALCQTANFHSGVCIFPSNEDRNDGRVFLENLNMYLPEDIAVYEIEAVDERFHSRFNAKSKTYRYRIHTGHISNVFERKYVYTYNDRSLDVELMRKASAVLLGTHDFRSFCGNRNMKKSTVRTIFNIDIRQDGDEIILDYTGDGFLQNMVRILTGTLIEAGAGKISPEQIEAILMAKDRTAAGFTAPACGLCLVRVEY